MAKYNELTPFKGLTPVWMTLCKDSDRSKRLIQLQQARWHYDVRLPCMAIAEGLFQNSLIYIACRTLCQGLQWLCHNVNNQICLCSKIFLINCWPWCGIVFRQLAIWSLWWTPSTPTIIHVRWCWSWSVSSSLQTRRWKRSFWRSSSSAVQQMVLSRSILKTRSCLRSSRTSGTSGWHWIAATTDRSVSLATVMVSVVIVEVLCRKYSEGRICVFLLILSLLIFIEVPHPFHECWWLHEQPSVCIAILCQLY